MLAPYAARLCDLRLGDFLKVDYAAYGPVALYYSEVLGSKQLTTGSLALSAMFA